MPVVVESDGQYVINGVIPPDEYQPNVNNSAYTNYVQSAPSFFSLSLYTGGRADGRQVASFSLNTACSWAQELESECPSQWSTIAGSIPIPFDPERLIHLEFDGYTNETIKQVRGSVWFSGSSSVGERGGILESGNKRLSHLCAGRCDTPWVPADDEDAAADTRE